MILFFFSSLGSIIAQKVTQDQPQVLVQGKEAVTLEYSMTPVIYSMVYSDTSSPAVGGWFSLFVRILITSKMPQKIATHWISRKQENLSHLSSQLHSWRTLQCISVRWESPQWDVWRRDLHQNPGPWSTCHRDQGRELPEQTGSDYSCTGIGLERRYSF